MYARTKRTPAPIRIPPGAAVTAAEFADLPFGGHAGEWLSGGQAAIAPTPPQPLVIEPPPWAGMEADPTLAVASVEAGFTPTALEAMRAEDGDDDRWPDPTAPVEVIPPMARFTPPPPDWRAEEAERECLRAAEAQESLEPLRSPYPVPRGAERA